MPILQKHERLVWHDVLDYLRRLNIEPELRRKKRHWAIYVPLNVPGNLITIAGSPKVDDRTLMMHFRGQIRRLLERAGRLKLE